MDDFDAPLQEIFSDHVDTVYRCLDTLGPALHAAVDAMCRAMLDEHRVLVCGSGTGSALAQLFCSLLLVRAHMDRPALPAICIGADAVALGSSAEHVGIAAGHARQLQAIAQKGDVLVVIAGTEDSGALAASMQVARNLGIACIALSGDTSHGISDTLSHDDIELRIPTADILRLRECQLLILDSMASLLENRLFGAG